MGRGRLAVVGAVVVAVLVAGGLSVGALRSTDRHSPASAAGAAVIRDPDRTIYVAPSDILFDVDSAALTADAVPVLRGIVADITSSRLAGTIRVEGYTDDSGSDGYNLALSRDRAATVGAWLVGAGGIARSRIEVVGLGEGSPAQPNDSSEHRRANRRVVIAVQR